MSVRPTLLSASLERVDRPFEGLFSIGLVNGALRCYLLLAAGPPRPRPGWALSDVRPRGETADGQVRGLREKLEGGRLAAFAEARDGWSLWVERGEVAWRLDGRREGVRCVPTSPGGGGADGAPVRGEAVPDEGRLAEAWRRGEGFVDEHRGHAVEAARRAALGLVRRARARLSKRLAAVEGDLEAAARAERRAREVAPFVAAAARAPRGAARLEATDWSTGEARYVALELDPAVPAREQLEAAFARARRLRAGAAVAERRRDEAQLGLWRLDEAGPAIAGAASGAEIEALVAALGRELPRDAVRGAPPAAPPGRPRPDAAPVREPFRRYEGGEGEILLVGRDAASNDALTVRVAKPGDLWVHVKGGAGAHVVVPGACRGGAPDGRALVDAATLAAHFSSLRGEPVVDVLYADRRHVRKRKGSAPGAVEAPGAKSLALRVEPERLARLLASLRPGPG